LDVGRDASGPDTAAVVESTGFAVERASFRTKPAFKVVQGRSPGRVKLFAKGAADGAFDGRLYSTDATHSGFAGRTTYFCQRRARTQDGQGNWGNTLSFSLACAKNFRSPVARSSHGRWVCR